MLHRSLVIPAVLVLAPLSALAQSTTRVSVDGSGAEANADSSYSAISPDGRFVAFDSNASNLVSGDVNGSRDIFLRDRMLGTTELVSVSLTGASGNAGSYMPSISADGRFVAFSSDASDLVAGDGNGLQDAFVRDRQLGTTLVVSVNSAGQMAWGGWSGAASISGDGQFVAFISTATNLGGTIQPSLYLHDMSGGVTTWIEGGSLDQSNSPALSFDGRYVAWGQTFSGQPQLVYVFDRLTHLISLGSSASGGQPNGWCYGPSLSDDGRYLAFTSIASNLVPNDMASMADVFVADLQLGTVERVSAAPGGVDADADAGSGRISADGRYVVLASGADNLVPNDTNGLPGHFAVGSDVFIRDRVLASTERVSLTDAGAQSDYGSQSGLPCVSADGRLAAFYSSATNLVAGDANVVGDVFVRDRGFPPPLTYCTAKMNSQGCTPAISYSGLPSMSGPDNFYVTASNVLNQKSGMMLWAGAQANTPFHGGFLCLAPPIVRTPLQNSGGNTSGSDCSGTYSYHFTQAYMQAQFLGPGSLVCSQFWSRDPGFPIPNNIGLTDALQFVIGP